MTLNSQLPIKVVDAAYSLKMGKIDGKRTRNFLERNQSVKRVHYTVFLLEYSQINTPMVFGDLN